MTRRIVRPLPAWDQAGYASLVLQPGTPVENYRILFNSTTSGSATAEPYFVVFEAAGRRYCCALVSFQARTQTVSEIPAAEPETLPASSQPPSAT